MALSPQLHAAARLEEERGGGETADAEPEDDHVEAGLRREDTHW